eukprot:Opistho-1_new@76103
MSVTSDEVNYLVYRYLLESGFVHAAYTFGNESHISRSNINGAEVPPGALVTMMQKGLQYVEAETHLTEDGEEIQCDEPFSLLLTHTCRGKKRSRKEGKDRKKDKKEKEVKRMKKEHTPLDEPMTDVSAIPYDAPPSSILQMEGHENEVFACAWNSVQPNFLASGSADGTARIWDVSAFEAARDSGGEKPKPIVLRHSGSAEERGKDVTTVDWSNDGQTLATGCYDGNIRIWSLKGQLVSLLSSHRAPVFALKYNKKGDYLLSAGVDKTAIVWDMATAQVKQVFAFHSAPTLDIDWRNNTSFATCSIDHLIHVCKVGEDRPLKTFSGHTSEVNAIKWDPTGTLLASCSDDASAKIWSLKQDTVVHDLVEHSKEIYTLRWSPYNTNSAYGSMLLATASFDGSVRLWEMTKGQCVHTLARHSLPVYSIAFSPDGQYIASGSFDKSILVWSVKDGAVVRKYSFTGGIFDVTWHPRGNKLAACTSDNMTYSLDWRM